MARITVEDCLKKIPNRYEMVKLAAKRVKQLAIDGREPTIDPEDCLLYTSPSPRDRG